MPIISLSTRIKAPVERVFDLSRSVDLHLKTSQDSQEKVVEGKASGLLEQGDEITWEGSHLKFRQKLHVKLTAMEPHQSFVDEMVSGAFARMKHVHLFEDKKGSTLMTDEFDYKSPGPLAWVVENCFLTAYLRRFLAERNKIIKQVAESEEWKEYLPDASPQD